VHSNKPFSKVNHFCTHTIGRHVQYYITKRFDVCELSSEKCSLFSNLTSVKLENNYCPFVFLHCRDSLFESLIYLDSF